MEIMLNWLDLSWIALVFLVLPRGQWLHAIAFILVCALSVRLQVELMETIGYSNGLLTFVDFPLLWRGFIAYGAFIAAFIGLTYYSPKSDHYILIAAAITIFTIAFCVSTFVMVL